LLIFIFIIVSKLLKLAFKLFVIFNNVDTYACKCLELVISSYFCRLSEQKQGPPPASQPPPVAAKPQTAPRPQVAPKPQKGRQAEAGEPAAADVVAAAPQAVGDISSHLKLFTSVLTTLNCDRG